MKESYVIFTAEVQKEQVARLREAITDAVNDGCDRLNLLISSGGGNVFEGLSIAAFIKALHIKVVSHNIGQIDSVANVIFAAGDERYATKSASFLFHGVTMQLNQNMIESQLLETYKNIQRLRESIATNFATYSGLKLNDVNALMDASGGKILTSTEALSIGIIHEVRDANIPKGVKVVSIGNA